MLIVSIREANVVTSGGGNDNSRWMNFPKVTWNHCGKCQISREKKWEGII